MKIVDKTKARELNTIYKTYPCEHIENKKHFCYNDEDKALFCFDNESDMNGFIGCFNSITKNKKPLDNTWNL